MEVSELQAFVAVADIGGFRAAAAALYISQPALSRMIGRLELDLGAKLFVRGPGGTKLTRQGEMLLASVRRVLTSVEALLGEAKSQSGATLRFGIAPTSAGSYLAPFLSKWIPLHPELRINMLNDGASRLAGRVESGECDAAIVAGPVPDTLKYLSITTVAVQAYVPPEHPLAASTEPLSVHDLDGERVLLNGRPYIATELLLAACNRAGSHPDVVYECSVSQSLAALAEAGLGIAVFGHSVDLRGFHLPQRPVQDGEGENLTFDLRVAWHRNARLPAAAMTFIEDLSAYMSASTAARPTEASRPATPRQRRARASRQEV